jgi:VWFA-related protein
MSKPYLHCLALPFLFLVAASAQQNPIQRPPSGPAPAAAPAAREGRIKLDVVVTDKSGKPVTGLNLSDFTLLDNKQLNQILSFHAVEGSVQKAGPPTEILLLIDAANVSIQGDNVVRDQVKKFLLENGGHLVVPVSLFLLTDEGIDILSSPSMDGNALAAKAGQINFGLKKIHDAGSWGAVQHLDLSLRTLTAIARSETKKPGRKLLLWFGTGWGTFDSSRPPAASKAQQQQWFGQIVQLSTLLRQARVSVYSLSGGTHVADFTYQEFLDGVKTADKANTADLTLKVLAVQSGGRILGPDNDLAGQIANCIQDGSAFYTISFDPPRASGPDEYHDLKIQIDKPKLTARTNTGYYNQPQAVR